MNWVAKPNFLTSKFYGVISDSTPVVSPVVLMSGTDFSPRKRLLEVCTCVTTEVGNNLGTHVCCLPARECVMSKVSVSTRTDAATDAVPDPTGKLMYRAQ